MQDRSSQDSLSETLGGPSLHVEQSFEAARELLGKSSRSESYRREGQVLAHLLIVSYHKSPLMSVQLTSDPYELDKDG
jgi:hypothetical protein